MIIPKSFSFTQFKNAAFITVESIDALKNQLQFCHHEKFTGQLNLQLQSLQEMWSLYFEKGYLIWATGGVHPVRCCYRQLLQCGLISPAPKDVTKDNLWSKDEALARLMQDQLPPNDMNSIVRGLIREILFDLYRQWARFPYSKLQMKFSYADEKFQPTVSGIPADEICLQALQDWRAWQQNGLAGYSPNQAALIWDAKGLQQQILPNTYQTLAAMLNGQQTLRDIAVQSNKSVLTLTKVLIPYIEQGLIKLAEIADLPLPRAPLLSQLTQPFSGSSFSSDSLAKMPLIAYVDDHEEDGQKMYEILSQLGYSCIHIQDPLQSLPLLLEHKPDLVFLDLVMPIINGYEVCAQIRRVSKFKDIPIIILTSSDGIVDRARAKFVGSTGFLAKPIKFHRVQAVLQKYLP
ncbi:response regulator [Leptolyngbya sp. 7M]|uniref:response regulator n=1 Tax=Leptolyngbya sp. 7M TaxID=2812896 RepID=UPI001B8AFCA0|nr:response regulator [Leptolyngbya sp. 7M]QYO63628.1 response regulator [Leptolyngbya sp. 7M]